MGNSRTVKTKRARRSNRYRATPNNLAKVDPSPQGWLPVPTASHHRRLRKTDRRRRLFPPKRTIRRLKVARHWQVPITGTRRWTGLPCPHPISTRSLFRPVRRTQPVKRSQVARSPMNLGIPCQHCQTTQRKKRPVDSAEPPCLQPARLCPIESPTAQIQPPLRSQLRPPTRQQSRPRLPTRRPARTTQRLAPTVSQVSPQRLASLRRLAVE